MKLSSAGALILCAGILSACSTVSTVVAEDSFHRPGMSTFRWIATPSGAEVLDVYPAAALDAGVSGAATLVCSFTAAGRLSNCVIEAETPRGWGFGQAAERVVDKFRFDPAAYPEMVGQRARQTVRFAPEPA
jgi:TonB family protein